MKVTYNWLKDFVDIDIPADKLAERLTMAGLEVEEIAAKDGDFVYTIEITSNRPDWLSVMGIAREVAAITGRKLKLPAAQPPSGLTEKIDISIADTNDCPLYTGRVIRGVKVGNSPEWMRKRLELVGVRPVNNVVDITNYVLFELGEPLHAFDLDKLKGGIVVRRARAGEKITAIDGKDYALDPGILVIADKERPVAIAGVMGGKDTEVSWSTRNVLLEAAVFNPVLVRRGRQKLGLQSEASYRFERGVDPLSPVTASARTAALAVEIAGGSARGESVCGASGPSGKTVTISPPRICAFLGEEIPVADIERVLIALGFPVAGKEGASIKVSVPSFRQDVKTEIDLVEEIARVYGYNAIPSCLPPMPVQYAEKRNPVFLIKETMMGQGLDEVLTYSLIDRKYLADFYNGSDIVEIANPLSNEQEILRPVLAPSLAKCVAYNLNQRQPSVAVFEVAKTYRSPDKETNVLGIAVSGNFSRWFGTQAGNVQFKAGFLRLKGILDALFSRLGIDPRESGYEYSGSRVISVAIKNQKMGELRKLSPAELALFDIKDKEVFLAEISLDSLLPLATSDRVFKAFSRFPWISRDITLEVSQDVPVEKILRSAESKGKGLLKDALFLDYYDKKLPAGRKRITISCVYSADDRTLTESEIAPVHEAVVNALAAEFSPEKK